MSININSSQIQNIKIPNKLAAYKTHSKEPQNTKKLAKQAEIKESNLRSVKSKELKDYLSNVEIQVINKLFDGNNRINKLPEFHSNNNLLTAGAKVDIKI